MSVKFEVKILNLKLSVSLTTQYGDDIKAMTFYKKTIFSKG